MNVVEIFTLITAITGVLIAAIAAYATLQQMKQATLQSRETIKHNRLSVRPVIDSWMHENDNTVHYWIQNKGFGTAKIVSWDFFIEGQASSNDDFKADLKSQLNGTNAIYDDAHMTPNSFIAKDEKITVIKIEFTDSVDQDLFEKLNKRYVFKINYESLYGDKYIFESE